MKGIVVIFVAAIAVASGVSASTGVKRPSAPPPGIEKIKHVVMIIQENRSFDSYFGTYPGADGIPRGVCVPDPRGGCIRPYHVSKDRNVGGPHSLKNAIRDINGGLMDGFVREAVAATKACRDPNDPVCVQPAAGTDVMGYHDAREIPNYWTYARNFVLQDHMYAPNASWSLPVHLLPVSRGRHSAK